jgi:formate hydrogenlyase transcriptional activator
VGRLRAIQEQELERVGGNRTIRVDVRFVAATNRYLKQMMEEGKFRSDLYYRLHVFPLHVPPLRERREDIPLLIRYFTQKHANRMNRKIEEIPSDRMEALTRYDWPGNIRELQNVIERSVILSPGRVLEIAPPEVAHSAAPPVRTRANDEAAERGRILQALREGGGTGRRGRAPGFAPHHAAIGDEAPPYRAAIPLTRLPPDSSENAPMGVHPRPVPFQYSRTESEQRPLVR